MTAIVVSYQPHGFGNYGEDEEPIEGENAQVCMGAATNDPLHGQPRSRYALEMTDDEEDDIMTPNDETSVASSSLPSLRDTDDFPDIFIVEESSKPQLYGGLNNLGNTCYLNSALQMIASADCFVQDLKKQSPIEESRLREALVDVLERLGGGETFCPDEFKSQVDERSSLFIGYLQQDAHEFLTTLLDLLDEDYKKLEQGDSTKNVETEAVEPIVQNITEDDDEVDYVLLPKKQRLGEDDDMFEEERSLRTIESFKDLQFDDIEHLLHGDRDTQAPTNEVMDRQDEPRYKLVGGRMNTPGAVLNRCEDRCVSGESTANLKTMQQDDSPATERKTYSPVDDHFKTQVRVCLTCDSCLFRRSHLETYLHLSLEVGPNCSSIEEGLRRFFAPERRQIKCEKCFCETAKQTVEITKLPRAVLFHLKRFIVDVSADYSSVSYRKDQSLVSFEESFGIDDDGVLAEALASDVSLPAGTKYGIRSVVNHIGSSASCGHYTADSKRLVHGEREWIRFNDCFVSKISDEEAIKHSSSTAYMVMYEIEP